MDRIVPVSQPTSTPDDAIIDADSRQLVDLWTCSQVVLRFTAHFDAGEHAEMETYFAPDGVWFQARGPIYGRIELRERMASMPANQLMRHVLTNIRPTIVGTDLAVVDSYFTVYLQTTSTGELPVTTSGPRNVGRYHDVLKRVEGRWLVAERTVHFDLKIDPSTA